jgi:hypothetical protein
MIGRVSALGAGTFRRVWRGALAFTAVHYGQRCIHIGAETRIVLFLLALASSFGDSLGASKSEPQINPRQRDKGACIKIKWRPAWSRFGPCTRKVGVRVRSRPVNTIGDLRRSGGALEYCCSRCGGTRLFSPASLPFGNLQSVATVHRRMHCSLCGEQGAASFTRAWFRHPGPDVLDSTL